MFKFCSIVNDSTSAPGVISKPKPGVLMSCTSALFSYYAESKHYVLIIVIIFLRGKVGAVLIASSAVFVLRV